RGPRAADRDVLGPLANDEGEIAAACRGVAADLPADSSAGRACAEAADELVRAARGLAVGRLDSARPQAVNAQGLLAAAAAVMGSKSEVAARFSAVRARQEELVVRLSRLATTPTVE